MNDVNTEMFFGEDENVVITLTNEDGTETEAMLVASFEVEELGREYLIAVDLDEDGGLTEEIEILRYSENKKGEPEIASIEDEEEYEMAAELVKQIIQDGSIEAFEGFEVEDDEDDDDILSADGKGYLDDIGDFLPGVSIDDK